MARHVTRMTIFDALHYTPEQARELIEQYPEHVRQARAMGVPAIGEGAVFPIDPKLITCTPFDVPPHWQEVAGLDFGWTHPTAAIRLVFDRESETFYVVQEYKKNKTLPIVHVDNLKKWGDHLKFAWGMEGLQTKLSENPEQTQKMFRKHGLKMVDVHATFADGGVGIERGVTELLELMEAGRFKIFSTCVQLLEEMSTYHRASKKEDKAAQIVGIHDDLIDAMRYAYMMVRYAVPVSWRKKWGGRPAPKNSARRMVDSRDIFGGR